MLISNKYLQFIPILVGYGLAVWSFPLAAQPNAIDSLTAALAVAVDNTNKVEILNSLAFELFRSEPERTLSYAQEALNLATKLDFKSGIAGSHRVIGIYHWAQGNYKEALRYQLKTLELYEELGDDWSLASSYNNLGAIYHKQGYYEKAISYYLQALAINENLADTLSIANTFNNIGIIMRLQEDYEKALEYYQKSLDIYESIGSKSDLATSYYNIGVIYLYQNKNKEALDYYNKSLAIREDMGDKSGMASCLHSIGAIHQSRANFKLGLDYYERSLEIADELGAKGILALDLVAIGGILFETKMYDESKRSLLRCLEIAEEIGDRRIAMEAYKTLSELESARDNHEASLDFYKHFTALDDSIYNTEQVMLISKMQGKYEIDKMESEIDLLNVRNESKTAELERKREELARHRTVIYSLITIFAIIVVFSVLLWRQLKQKRKMNELLSERNIQMRHQQKLLGQQRDELRRLNATKDRFFAIIAHDLRNPLTALLSTTRSLTEFGDQLSKEETHLHMEMMHESAKRLYTLVENLLQWALSQTEMQQIECTSLNLGKVVNDVLGLLRGSATEREVSLAGDIEDDMVIWADINMLRIVLRNLIGNAIKFSEHGGQVEVGAESVDGTVTITVADSGIGISKEDQSALFDLEGIDKSGGTTDRKGTGLGLILCREFVTKMGGEIRVESQAGRGSCFMFTVPTGIDLYR